MEIPTSAGSFQQTNLNATSSSANRRYYNPSLQLHQYANYPVIAQLTTPPNQSLSVFGTPSTTFSNPATGIESVFNPNGSNNGTLFSFTGTTSSGHQQRERTSNSGNIRNLTSNSNSANISTSGINKFNTSATRNTSTGVRPHFNNYLKQSHHSQQQHRTNMNNACNNYPQQNPNYPPQSLQNQQQHNPQHSQNQNIRNSTVMGSSSPAATATPATHSGANNTIPTNGSHVPSSGANPSESQAGLEPPPPQYRIFKRGDSMTAGGMTSPPIATVANANATQEDGQKDQVNIECTPNTRNANDSSKLENGIISLCNIRTLT